jgi:hypothetical protein
MDDKVVKIPAAPQDLFSAPPTDGGLTVEEIAALKEAGPSDAQFTGHTIMADGSELPAPSEHEEVR